MKFNFIFFLLFITTLNSCSQKQNSNLKNKKDQANKMMEDLYTTVKNRDKKVYYDIRIFNGACNYKIWINDLPAFSMYNNARGEISIPINGKILRSGKQRLKIKLFPFYDDNKKLKEILNPYAGLDIVVREMQWVPDAKKFDYFPVFSYQTPREEEKSLEEQSSKLLTENENLSYFEEEVTFEVNVPYQLKGWTQSVNLDKEDPIKLEKEVLEFYETLARDFEKKNISAIAEKYYSKEKEVAQCFFHNEKEAKTRWNQDILEKIIDPSATIKKLEKYQLEFFGDGKVVSLMRFPGKSPLCVVTKKDGKSKYSIYDVFLHRPKPGAPLEMIR